MVVSMTNWCSAHALGSRTARGEVCDGQDCRVFSAHALGSRPQEMRCAVVKIGEGSNLIYSQVEIA